MKDQRKKKQSLKKVKDKVSKNSKTIHQKKQNSSLKEDEITNNQKKSLKQRRQSQKTKNQFKNDEKKVFQTPSNKKRLDLNLKSRRYNKQNISKNRLKLKEEYSPIPQKKVVTQQLNNDSQISELYKKLNNKNSEKLKNEDDKKQINKNQSDTPKKLSMEEFENYLEQEEQKDQSSYISDIKSNNIIQNNFSQHNSLYDNKSQSLQSSYVEPNSMLNKGFIQDKSTQKLKQSKQKFADLMHDEIVQIDEQTDEKNKWERRNRFSPLLEFMNEQVIRKNDSTQLKRISIENKDNYLSKYPNSIYYHPQELKSDKKKRIRKNFKQEQLEDIQVVKIFENDEEIKYRFNLELNKEKIICKTNEKIQIQVYNYTQTKILVSYGKKQDDMQDIILKNNEEILILKGKQKAHMCITKIKNKNNNQLNMIIIISKLVKLILQKFKSIIQFKFIQIHWINYFVFGFIQCIEIISKLVFFFNCFIEFSLNTNLKNILFFFLNSKRQSIFILNSISISSTNLYLKLFFAKIRPFLVFLLQYYNLPTKKFYQQFFSCKLPQLELLLNIDSLKFLLQSIELVLLNY